MKLNVNGIEIKVDVQGPAGGDPLLLIMGLGMQLTGWPLELVSDLCARGFRVIRLDNRDAGLSQGFEHAPRTPFWRVVMRHALGLPILPAYRLADMAADCVGVLDALGIERAHVCGASMGGMIAQHLAARYPARVKSLALIMTSSGAPRLPQPSLKVRRAMLKRPRSQREEDVVPHISRLFKTIGSREIAQDETLMNERLRNAVRRAWRPDGTRRQLIAIAADGDRSALLAHITAPTLVLHGAADPLIPPAAAEDLARRIPGAALDLIPKMGHDLPHVLLPRIAEKIAANAARAKA